MKQICYLVALYTKLTKPMAGPLTVEYSAAVSLRTWI